MSRNVEPDTTLGLVRPVVAVGAVLTLLAPFAFGTNSVVGVALGAAIAALNLWAIANVVRGILRGNGLPWGAVAAVKFAALLFLVWIVLKNHWADAASLALGYASLPVGIVIGQLGRTAPARREG